MDYKTITPEMLGQANSYVPALQKQQFVEYAAARCIDKIEIKVANEQPMPPSFKANALNKSRYLMGAFIRLYLKQEYEPVEDDEWLMAVDDFDRWSGGHIFKQIDRMKKAGGELCDKAFDLLEDYANLKRMLYAEIDGMLVIMNDPVQRLSTAMMMQTTPEAMEKQMAELERVKDELSAYADGLKETGVDE